MIDPAKRCHEWAAEMLALNGDVKATSKLMGKRLGELLQEGNEEVTCRTMRTWIHECNLMVNPTLMGKAFAAFHRAHGPAIMKAHDNFFKNDQPPILLTPYPNEN